MTPPSSQPNSPNRPAPGLVGRVFGVFNSVTFGIVWMSILFVYCTIGSAGILYPVHPNIFDADSWVHAQMRQWRPFEMTEFEWFHWWPFDLLMLLICINITVVTLKRIKLNAVNAGVWMIHTGILVLCLGSVIYFTTKVEGDSPVTRRQVTITTPEGATGTLPAVPGTQAIIGEGPDTWQFQVYSCDPEWEILTGEHAGQKTFAVTLAASGGGKQFMRQLLAGYPEYTEDIVASGDEGQPMGRAVKVLGTPLVDESLKVSLEFQPQSWFYLANWVSKSWALYVRELKPDGSTTPWVERPIDDMPLYNDYVRSTEEVWLSDGDALPADPLDITVDSAHPDDPIGDLPIRVTNYLRYAQMQTRQVPGGNELAPAVSITLDDGRGTVVEEDLEAFDPTRATAQGGFVGLVWAGSEDAQRTVAQARSHELTFKIPGQQGEFVHEIEAVSFNDRGLAWLPVPESDYEFRVEFVEDLRGRGGGSRMASVELRTPEREFRRWLFEDGSRTHDVSPAKEVVADDEPHDHSDPDHVHEEDEGGNRLIPDEVFPLDEGIEIVYLPGQRPPPLTIVAGPGRNDLGVVFHFGTPDDGTYMPVSLGERVSLGRGESLVVNDLLTHSSTQTRPLVIPNYARNRDVKEGNSMVRLQIVAGGESHEPWVSFHRYPFDHPNDTLRRFRYRPARVQLADGRFIELILSRQRLPLPAPVVLDDFTVTPHVGGFTGRTSSILNWTSQVRFADASGAWGDTLPVSVNAPAENNDLWFFQAQWDPPMGPRFQGDPSSQGLNYTVLGVGNRHGVGIQLWGCTISVLGMLYAFYVKPQIRRRRREQAQGAGTAPRRPSPSLATPLTSMPALSEEKA